MIRLNLDYSLENIFCSLMALDILNPLCDFSKESPALLTLKKITDKDFLAQIVAFSNRKKLRVLSESILLTAKIIYSGRSMESQHLTSEQVLLTKNYFKRFRYVYYLYFAASSHEKSLKDLNTIALRMLTLFH